jgi:hypothetical protein
MTGLLSGLQVSALGSQAVRPALIVGLMYVGILGRVENSRRSCAPEPRGKRMNQAADEIVLEARSITKQYPETLSLDPRSGGKQRGMI